MDPAHPAFDTTHRSLVLRAGQSTTAEAETALNQLCLTYWYPLYAYVRRRGYSREDAQDLTQEFFSRLLQRDSLTGLDPSKGKFRSFLLVSMNHFLVNEWERARAARRGGGRLPIPLDDAEHERRYLFESASDCSPERLFDRQWALNLLDRALLKLSQEYGAAGKSAQFEQLKGFLSGDGGEVTYAQLAADWHMSPNAVAAAVYRLRQRYRESVRELIGQTVAGPRELEEELRALFDALG